MLLKELGKKIKKKTAAIGLPVAFAFAEAGFDVIDLDIKAARVDSIRKRRKPIQEEEPGLAPLLKNTLGSGRLRATTEHRDLNQEGE